MAAPRGSEVWRDYVTDGIPSSGNNKPKKSDIRSWTDWLESLVTSGVLSSGPWFTTKAAMSLAYAANTVAVVYNDPAAANNGLHIKSGASGAGFWTQLTSFLPGYQFVTAAPAGASTANAIVASTSPRLPSGDGVALVTLAVPHTNTDTPVTVSFDGAPTLTIKTRTGENPDVGELQQNDVVAGFVSGATFRLISDLNSLRNYQSAKAWANNDEDAPIPAILGGDGATTFSAKHWAAKSDEGADRSSDEADRSQGAADQAEEYRDQAAGFVNEIVSEKEVPIYSTVAGMPFINVPVGMSVINVRGRNSISDGDGGLYGTANNGSPDKFTSLDGRTWYKIFKKPLIIAVSGQSNPANVRDYAWQPESNLYVWNATGTAIGTAFAVADNTKISFPVAFANEVARQNPDRSVFVVTGARPGRTIVNWLPGAPDEDVYALLKTRVEAALSVLGTSKIDRFAWWQGESDAADPSAYEANFEAVITRLRGENWFPYNTNMTIMGIVSTAINGDPVYRSMNIILQRCAAKDPQNRMYFYTVGASVAAIDPTGAAGDWADVLHVNAQGTFNVGTAAAKKTLAGGGGYAGNGLWKDPETGNFGLGLSSLAGQLFDIRKDADSAAMIRAANLHTGPAADTGFLALCANGSLDLRAYGSSQSGRAQIAWSGTTSLDLKASNAAGGLRFFVGSAAENMRLTLSGLNLLSGVLFLSSQQVLKQRIAGWATPTGTVARSNFNPATISLADLAAQVNALKTDLHAGSGGHGMIGN
ncbi:sialate O-acetylesterase [Agrobacterium tumefaciens]|uniref:sialate O-acetylesterase n=1 Tax=Agrobacterium tumefaciens TaxID=358 RepID=UPI001574327E|nr:sialate O-acetylesterase [Agrobacterium tumefaciens]